jgi:L-threonylcarbamoyladenylate synthase
MEDKFDIWQKPRFRKNNINNQIMKEDVEKALEVLRGGGVIVYPTDTVWGLGCDATNDRAVEKIYRIKKRADSKSMLTLLDSESRLPSYIREVPEIAWELIEATDTPVTIIYPDARNLAVNLLAEDGSAGIRITSDPFCKALISRLKKPLVSTSANISGETAPALFSEISDEILSQADYIVKWRQEDMARSKPSSIIKLEHGGVFTIIR